MFTRSLRRLAPALFCLVLLVACQSAPSPYDQVQEETSGRKAPAAVVEGAEKGGTFNQFFPEGTGDYSVVPAQEKKGFAEYKLNRGGETLAMLSINDTISLPAAAAKYDSSSETLSGYPLVDQGTTASGLLVNGRYQVKVLSRSADFTRDDRLQWLQQFDLDGLAQLEPAPAQSTAPAPARAKVEQRLQRPQPDAETPATTAAKAAAPTPTFPEAELETTAADVAAPAPETDIPAATAPEVTPDAVPPTPAATPQAEAEPAAAQAPPETPATTAAKAATPTPESPEADLDTTAADAAEPAADPVLQPAA